jgi:OOP family OmpA-OmpF porin
MSLIALAGPATALDLALPEGATLVAATPPTLGTYVLATAPWDGTHVPTATADGMVRDATWQMPFSAGAGTSIAAVTAGIESQLRDQGYRIDLDCSDTACGGFDFRMALDMGQSPEMHVDIGNFRYLAASGTEAGEAVAVTVSAAGQTLYVHVVHVGAATGPADPWVTPSSRAPQGATGAGIPSPLVPTDPAAPGDLIARLTEFGSAPLEDLRFRTGASDLSGQDYASLAALAGFLDENPNRRVVLVGHTDAQGGRDGNLALSRARADAVRRYLIDRLGVDTAQLASDGIGFLAPRASNETAEGREANRRVEVVLLDDG